MTNFFDRMLHPESDNWFDRLGKFVASVPNALEAPFGLAADLATAPWNDDDEYDGFLSNLFGKTADRLGQAVSPFSAAFNLLYLDKALAGQQWLYSEAVSQPLSTAWNMLARGADDPANLFSGQQWQDAYHVAEHTSPGRQIEATLSALRTESPVLGVVATGLFPFMGYGDRVTLEQAANDPLGESVRSGPLYGFRTGLVDAITGFAFDPTVVGGKVAAVARTAAAVRPLKGGNIESYIDGSSYARFRDWAMGKTASEIHSNPAVKRSTYGASIAHLYSQAETPEQFDRITRVALGNLEELQALKAERSDLAIQTARALSSDNPSLALAVRESAAGRPLSDEDIGGLARLAEVNDEVKAMTDRDVNLQKMLSVQASMTRSTPGAPGQNRLSDMRYGWREKTYQKSPYATAVRVLSWAPDKFRQMPSGWIDLNRADAHTELNAMLRQVPGMDPEERLGYVNKYMGAASEAERMAVVRSAEQKAIKVTLDKYGLKPGDADKLAALTLTRRDTIMRALRTRSYSGAHIDTPEGGKIFADEFGFIDDDGVAVHMPILETELANMLPVVDIKRIQDLAKRHQNTFRALSGAGRDVFTHASDVFNQMWKFSVLMRLGYPTRVLIDDQLRIIAKLGAMTSIENTSHGLANFMRNRRYPGAGFKIGEGTVHYKGMTFPGAFSGDTGAVFRGLTSSAPDWQRNMTLVESDLYQKVTGSGNFQPSSAFDNEGRHLEAWADSINTHLRTSEISTKLINGWSPERVVRWLNTEPAGLSLKRRLPWAGADPEGWVYRVGAMVDQYLPHGLHDIARERPVSLDDLKAINIHERPVVHGELLQHNMGVGPAAQVMNAVMEKGMKWLGQLPTDVLSRQPLFDALYRQRMGELADIYSPQLEANALKGFTTEMVSDMARQSREFALREVRKTLFDVASRSSAAHTFRFLAPFFSAWQETLVTWAGLARENPAILARAGILWSAPNRAGMIVDGEGNKVPPTAGINDDQYFMVQMPPWMKQAPWPIGQGLESLDRMMIPKGAFNLALQGEPWFLPGSGPIAQIPVNVMVKDRPELADSLKFILPYGPVEDSVDLALPTVVKRLKSRLQGEEDASYRDAMAVIWANEMTDYRLGKRATTPDMAEIKRKTNQLFSLRTFANAVLPFSPQFQTPYKFYLDQYHKLREVNPRTADEEFYNRFGKDYFAFALSVSKNNTGIPASLRAVRASKKYADLIGKFPELGGLIVGAEGDGDFDLAAYRYQQANPVGPGTMVHGREKQDIRSVIQDNQAREGWIEYRKIANSLEAERITRGLTSLDSFGGEDLRALKDAFVLKLKETNQAWAKDFDQRDEGRVARTLLALREIATDSRMARNSDRTDMQSALAYLTVRDQFVQILQERKAFGGASTLRAAENGDVKEMWEAVVGQLIERDTKFGDLYARYLERDDLRPI